MPERRLWKTLAELWDMATPFAGSLSKPAYHVEPVPGDVSQRGHEPCFGVCQCLVRMIDNKKIDQHVFDKAHKRLHVHLTECEWNRAYLFPLDGGGAKCRADLCREMAEQCRKEEIR